jgi:4,5-DOPA dioxygenase extradiol
MTTPSKAPVLFISHGAPTFALDPGVLGAQLKALGAQLEGIKAVLLVSPHWQTRNVQVMTTVKPETLYDFGGFPAELYKLSYPANGAPEVAREAARLLVQAGLAVGFDEQRGLDHGAWVPLFHLLPKVNLPVFQVSMPVTLDPAQAVKLGQALTAIREQGVLIVASGSMTHNLYEVRQPGSQAQAYTQEFTAWVRAAVLAKATGSVVAYRSEAPHAERAHPTDEHFLPLLIAMGAAGTADPVRVLDGGITYGVISMESYVWGLA